MQRGCTVVAVLAAGCGRIWFDPLADAGPGLVDTHDAPDAPGCIRQLASEGDHVCALRDDGQLWCWGFNGQGQLGDNTQTSRTAPGPAMIDDVIAIGSGEQTMCAIKSDRSLYCWGAGDSGQIGNGIQADRHVPTAVALPARVVDVKSGQSHTCARLDDDTGWCWGANGAGQLGMPASAGLELSPIAAPIYRAVELGGEFTCTLAVDARLLCFGTNAFGQLGDGTQTARHVPQPVAAITDPVVHFSAGCHRHACAVTDVGEVWCWGDNSQGQVGTAISAFEATPIRVAGVPAAVEVAVGVFSTCARTGTGEVWCWGDNAAGQLGNNSFADSLVPVQVVGIGGDASVLETGCATGIVVRADGVLLAWGSANTLGTGETADRATAAPVPLPCP